MAYDSQIVQIKEKLASASGVLIAVSTLLNEDKLGAALALALALKEAGKNVSVVTAGTPKVSHSNLFGIGEITDRLPQGKGGNLTLSLEGVVDSEGKVPSLERLDWFPKGADLNLVFHVVPGQKFEPINVKTSYDQASFDLVVVIGARHLDDLGFVYKQNSQAFSNVTLVDIDTSASNTNFGAINIVDQSGTSISEIMLSVLNGVGLPVNADISSNILAGIYKVTENLTKNVQATTFLAVGQAMQSGGKMPQAVQGNPKGSFDPKPFMNQPRSEEQKTRESENLSQSAPQVQPAQTNQPMQPIQDPQPQVGRDTVQPQTPIAPHVEESTQPARVDNASFAPTEPKSEEEIPTPVQEPVDQNFQHPLDVNVPAEEPVTKPETQPQAQTMQSADEKPMAEQVSTGNPESPAPDWLTPKIFKGGSLG